METAETLATAAARVMADIVAGDMSTVEDEAARDLFVSVADRLSLTRGGELILDRFEERPDDVRVWNGLRHAVMEQARRDDIFAATLRRAVRGLQIHIGPVVVEHPSATREDACLRGHPPARARVRQSAPNPPRDATSRTPHRVDPRSDKPHGGRCLRIVLATPLTRGRWEDQSPRHSRPVPIPG